MMNGHVILRGSAGNGAAAAIRGGTVVIHGDAAARLGISMKGGTVVVAGNCGYMAGFMAQKGTLIVCGDAGEAFADSMYETVCYVGGKIADLGNDAVLEAPSPDDAKFIDSLLARYLEPEARRGLPAGGDFKKIVAGRKLWNFDKRAWKTWQEAL
jgi:formylmethanofuran dehydrogenase subunit C